MTLTINRGRTRRGPVHEGPARRRPAALPAGWSAWEPPAALGIQVGLLALLGVGPAGRLTGTAVAVAVWVLVAAGCHREGRSLGPADRVTLARTVLIGGVSALVADQMVGGRADNAALLVALASVALLLDGVDGQVARRTGTVSSFGARFDMESDAFLVLVLSVKVAEDLGPWVPAIGAMRYVFGAAAWGMPWLRAPLPHSRARKTVAVVQGVALTAATVVPYPVAIVSVGAALALLVWSFGRDVVWLFGQRGEKTSGESTIMDKAFWTTSPGEGEIRPADVPDPGPDEVRVRTTYSGVSRGTETLVFRGGVPASQYDAMRAPFQEGTFPGPVKYGYLNVGVVEQGPAQLLGRDVFCLYPHQTRYVVPATAVTPLPEGVPLGRAVLAGTVETAVNALWDAAPLVGDRVAVVGAGMVGCSVAGVLAGFPGIRVQLVDTDPSRADIARALGVRFAHPGEADEDCDLVLHASATEAGLARSLELLAPEGEVIELSWYGDRRVSIPLGENFHSRRLVVRSSQVGAVSPARRARRGFADRLALALRLLSDPRFDSLVTGESRFEELPRVMPRLAKGDLPALCHRIVYHPA